MMALRKRADKKTKKQNDVKAIKNFGKLKKVVFSKEDKDSILMSFRRFKESVGYNYSGK